MVCWCVNVITRLFIGVQGMLVCVHDTRCYVCKCTMYVCMFMYMLPLCVVSVCTVQGILLSTCLLQVVDMCHEDGEVSPATCIYMKEWLDKAIKF